jgi:hypothetical protein
MLTFPHMKNTIRSIYFYAATLIFLIMSVIAMISLLNLALKTYVFTKADMAYGQQCDDRGEMYYAPKPVMAPGETPAAVKELTAEEKAANKAACEKNLADQKSAEHQRDLVQYLSMLVVAAPLFWIHFKWVQKERETELKMADHEEKKA